MRANLNFNSIRREFLIIGVLIMAILAGLGIALIEKVKVSPERDFSANGIVLKFRVSDHKSDSSFLPNSLNDNSTPDFIGSDQPELLNRDANGNISVIPRFQGEIDYK